MKKNKSTNEINKGFTLIELLVVIAIIGILGAIIYAPFQSARRKGRDAQRVIEMKNLVSSLTLYADSHHGYFPCTLAVLQAGQSDSLPAAANLNPADAGGSDNSKYNYVAYTDGVADSNVDSGDTTHCPNRVIGYHLWTHLETANAAINGGGKCQGINNVAGTFDPNKCINVPSTAPNTRYGTEPAEGAGVHFLAANRVVTPSTGTPTAGDTDSICATNSSYCILDYHQ